MNDVDVGYDAEAPFPTGSTSMSAPSPIGPAPPGDDALRRSTSTSTSTIDEDEVEVTRVNPPLDAADVDSPWRPPPWMAIGLLYPIGSGAALLILGPASAIADSGSDEGRVLSMGDDCEDMIRDGLGVVESGSEVVLGVLIELVLASGSVIGFVIVDGDVSPSCNVIRRLDALLVLATRGGQMVSAGLQWMNQTQ